MSAICGVVGLDGRPWATADLDGMLRRLSPLGPDSSDRWAGSAGRCGVAVAALLRHDTPEDASDRQPRLDGDGSLVLVGDLRVDNRGDLAGSLDLVDDRATPDSAFFLAGYARWGEGVLDRVVGEFAVALVDRRRGGILLARDRVGAKPLCIHERPGVVAFASMPLALAGLEGVGHTLDVHHVAEIVAVAYSSERTFVEGVRWLPGGTAVWIDESGARRRRWWNPDPHGIVDLGSPSAHEAELRDALELAVSARLRTTGRVGATISGGLDSTSIAATAARLLAPETLPTFTTVPPPGWRQGNRPGWDANESSLVLDLAKEHPNLEPAFVEAPRAPSLLEAQEPLWELGAGPARNPCNMLWIIEIRRRAGASGITAVLGGEMGNLFLSADGPGWLAALVRAGRPVQSVREARAWTRASGSTWRGVLRSQVGYLIPPGSLRLARRLARRPAPVDEWISQTALRAGLASEVAIRELLPQLDDSRRVDGRAVALEGFRHLAGQADVASALAAVTGAVGRDPAVDQRIVEAALRQPEWARRHDGVPRAVVRGAMADRLPESIVSRTRRGEQLPDWLDVMTAQRAELAAELEEVKRHSVAREIVDTERLDRLMTRWPKPGERADFRVVGDYRLALLRALVVGRYLRWFDEGRAKSTARR